MLGLDDKYGEGVMPVGCVRVGYVDGTLVLDPDVQTLDQSGLDLLYAGN
jgi:polyribonucleotide nucleotidyltransferase